MVIFLGNFVLANNVLTKKLQTNCKLITIVSQTEISLRQYNREFYLITEEIEQNSSSLHEGGLLRLFLKVSITIPIAHDRHKETIRQGIYLCDFHNRSVNRNIITTIIS